MDRRRGGQPARSPLDVLQQMPALVLLERLPVPVLAVGESGVILFANPAFAAMLGHPVEAVLAMSYRDIFQTLPDYAVVAVMRAHADLVVELRHADGSTVRARLGTSVLRRGDDPLALATFQDLTEQLWEAGS